MKQLSNLLPVACLMASTTLNLHSVQCADMLQALTKTSSSPLLKSSQQCMSFQCTIDSRLDGMDLCYKADHLQENLGIVHLKMCPEGQMCHGKLNRCMADPYNMFEGKTPGQSCKHNYQCASGACITADDLSD